MGKGHGPVIRVHNQLGGKGKLINVLVSAMGHQEQLSAVVLVAVGDE